MRSPAAMMNFRGKEPSFSAISEAHQPGGIRDDYVIAIDSHARVELARLRFANGGTENPKLFAGQKRDPTAHPIARIKSTHHPVARSKAVFPESSSFVTGRMFQLIVGEIDTLGRSGSSGCLKNCLRRAAEEILSRVRDEVFRRGENISQVFRPANLQSIQPPLMQLCGKELLVSGGMAHHTAERILLHPVNYWSRRELAPFHQGRHRIADDRALEKLFECVQHESCGTASSRSRLHKKCGFSRTERRRSEQINVSRLLQQRLANLRDGMRGLGASNFARRARHSLSLFRPVQQMSYQRRNLLQLLSVRSDLMLNQILNVPFFRTRNRMHQDHREAGSERLGNCQTPGFCDQ